MQTPTERQAIIAPPVGRKETLVNERRQFVPIFETKDGNRLFVCLNDFVGTDEDDAWKIAVGASLVECILWGIRPTWKSVDVTEGIPHRKADLGGVPVAIISGPLFDEATTPPADAYKEEM